MSAITASERVLSLAPDAPRFLGARSTRTLLRHLQHTGDPNALDILVKRFLPLARKLARRYYGGGEPLEDLVQVASLGLVKAVQRYDESRGVSFTSYAIPTITGELKRYFRDHAWAAHVPRGMQERALQVNEAIRELSDKDGRTPNPRELAERLELGEDEVLDALGAYLAFDAVSLDEPAGPQEDEHQSRCETIGSVDSGYELAEARLTVDREIRKLPARERRVLHMRFVEDRTQAEIAVRTGVSQMQISRILRRTLDHLSDTVERPRPPSSESAVGSLSVASCRPAGCETAAR